MAQNKISVIINTLNEAKNIARAIQSVKWADEILVCDMQSDDETAVIARKMGAVVFYYKRMDFVEPARNFAISKASHEWVLVVDADEEVPESLAKYLREMLEKPIVSTFVEIPRKNIIFNKWMRTSMWWPDYNIRFFKPEAVTWSNQIHRPPKTVGQGIKLPQEERWAIVHHNYNNIAQFIDRMNRYSTIQARELKASGVEFKWPDLLIKPTEEFLSRFFANKGYEDGLHGLSLSLLQAFSFFVVYLKLWETTDFKETSIPLSSVKVETDQIGEQVSYWFNTISLSKNPLKRVIQKARHKVNHKLS